MNALTITGNLVADVKAVPFGDDKQLADFRIANNELVDGKSVSNGFFDVVAFGALAKHVIESFSKGSPVIVSGRLDQREFEREDGSKGYRIKIVAQAVGASVQFGKATHA